MGIDCGGPELELAVLAWVGVASAGAESFLLRGGWRRKMWRRKRWGREGRRLVVLERISECTPQAASSPYHIDLPFASALLDWT